ncbi:hypothetical protein DK254_06120 [Pseudomonas sp. RW407]|uniref:DUF7380 domain-containing protein n=1 Tax=Pseudomonas sp. RW407 TaxID=2202894 RepID=UPI000D6F27C6|nr:hypothetical protein [Pseudomonas sp. RW407]PWU31011.1 hypothetical protein DK254_06120 [Pseudomonas sp. RW407]
MTEQDDEKPVSPMDLASAEDFEVILARSILSMSNSLHFHTLERVFQDAAGEADGRGDSSSGRAYRVLAVVCGYHFNPTRADTFTPQIVMDGKRTLIPSDYFGAQQDVLVEVAEKIDHPLVRARVADSCWFVQKKLYAMARLAIDSYFSAVESFFKKELLFQYESESWVPHKVVDLIERAISISAFIGQRKKPSAKMKEIFAVSYTKAQENGDLVSFCRLANLGEPHALISWNKISKDSEELASKNLAKKHPEAVKKVWELAAYAYSRVGDSAAARNCKERAVDQILRMRDGATSAIVKATWTRDAIGALRKIGNAQERIDALKRELQEFEQASLSEFGTFRIPMDLTAERQATIDEFESLDVHEMLFRLAFIIRIPEKFELHRQCLEGRKNSFLSSFFGKSFSDANGKVIANVPSTPIDVNPSVEWFDYESLSKIDVEINYAVEAHVKPACITMSRYQSIDERHLESLTFNSPFVPAGHEAVFATGFARLIQGDMVTACHLLIPQLENSLRHVLNSQGKSTAKMNVDLTQEDQSLSQMYSNKRDELESIFGSDVVYVIHLLFNLKGGHMLRHEMAHGKFTTGLCFQPAAIYACWIIFHLVCLPLYTYWEPHISNAIQEVDH